MSPAEELAIKHSCASWDGGDKDGYGGEWVADKRTVAAINEALERAAQEAESSYDAGRLADRSPKCIAARIRALKD